MKKYEDAFARILALELDLIFGVNLFTSQIPENLDEGIAVSFGNQIDENEWEIPKFNVQIFMKSPSRSSCQKVLAKLMAEFPKYGVVDSVSGVRFDEILRRGNGAIVRVTDNGKTTFEMVFNMVAVFKIQ